MSTAIALEQARALDRARTKPEPLFFRCSLRKYRDYGKALRALSFLQKQSVAPLVVVLCSTCKAHHIRTEGSI